MLYLLKFIPRRYWPMCRIVIGVVGVVLGITVFGRVVWVVGAVVIVWGVATGLGALRRGTDDDRSLDR